MRVGMAGMKIGRTAALALGIAAWSHGQVAWQTTHTNNEGGGYNSGNCSLVGGSVRIGVHPGYLDAEEDVEIGVEGAVSIGNDGKSLEMVGEFSLPAGSAVTGALLWDGDRILQGKLLDRNIAQTLYDSLVERNSTPPPRPRDPLLLEKIRDDGYRFRIYPVALGHSRHMRLRYQLPAVASSQGLLLPFKAAVIPGFGGSASQIPVTFQNADRSPKVIYSYDGNRRMEMALPRTQLLSPYELSGTGQGTDIWGQVSATPGIVIQSTVPVFQAAIKTGFAEGQMAGNYLNLYATVSQEVLKGLNIRSATSLSAVIKNAGNTYAIPVSCPDGLAAGCGSATFNGKSDAVWEDSVQWEAYDASGKLLAKAKLKANVMEAAHDTGSAVLWAKSTSHFSEKKELPLGPVFGFVDEWASLLSLPGDSVTPALAAFYAANGVPRVANFTIKDVVPNYASDQVPNNTNPGAPDPGNPNQWTTALAARLGVLADPSSWRVERLQGGFIVRIRGLAAGMGATVQLFDLAGKLAGYWAPRSEEGALNLSSAAVRPGIYLLKVRIAGKMSVKRIVL